MAETRICHAVLWDVHGGLLEHDIRPYRSAPGERRDRWSEYVYATLQEGGADFSEIMTDHLESMALWRRRVRIEIDHLKAQSAAGAGRTPSHKEYLLGVNVELLRWVAPAFMGRISEEQRIHCARVLFGKRRTDQHEYALSAGMAELVRKLERQGIVLCLITAQTRERAEELLQEHALPPGRSRKLYASGDAGVPKSHSAYWPTLCARLGFSTSHVVCIEDSPSLGLNVVRSGMALFLVDRDGASAAFIREECGGNLGGAPLLTVENRFPVAGPFVVCVPGHEELGKGLQKMRQSE